MFFAVTYFLDKNKFFYKKRLPKREPNRIFRRLSAECTVFAEINLTTDISEAYLIIPPIETKIPIFKTAMAEQAVKIIAFFIIIAVCPIGHKFSQFLTEKLTGYRAAIFPNAVKVPFTDIERKLSLLTFPFLKPAAVVSHILRQESYSRAIV